MTPDSRPAACLRARLVACLAAFAACALFACVLASPALALTIDKTTGRGSNSDNTIVLGGVATRFTWEGTVGSDEELSELAFAFPDGTTVSDESSVRVTILGGDDHMTRITDIAYETALDGAGLSLVFSEPIPADTLVRVEIYKLAPPAETMTFTMDVTYVDSFGEEVDLGATPGVAVVEQGVVENIVEWLDDQGWVAAWNSNTFCRLFLNPQVAVQAVPNLFGGWLRALSLVLVGFPLAIPIGFALSFMRMSKFRLLRAIGGTYVNVVRGTPLFLQIYIYFFGLPLLGININNFLLGIIALALNSAAYLCEIFRAGIQSIPKGQFEASRSLGMNGAQTMFSVIIPQSVRRVIPTATSEFILLYKDTSLLASVGVMELMMFSKSLTATTGNITPYIVAAAYYLVVTIPLTKLIGVFEQKLAAAEGARPADDNAAAGKSIGVAVAAAATGDVTPVVVASQVDDALAPRPAHDDEGGAR